MRIPRYHGIRGRSRVDAIAAAIEASGGRVLRRASSNIAPFDFRVAFQDNSEIELVCYAFTANKYTQAGRPTDEHRFQVKYGSEFDRPHKLFVDDTRERVTLFFGVHEHEGLFIAVDPAMHNPTWFSMSIEFKDAELDETERTGWHGWERERVAGGRRRAHPLINLSTEAVLAFKPEHFLTYARFERVATGLDPGERLLLVDQIGEDIRARRSSKLAAAVGTIVPANHPMLQQFGVSVDALLDLIASNFRLLVAVRGGVAEHHLHEHLKSLRELSKVTKIDEDGQPDFEVVYRRGVYRIECKNVNRKRPRDSDARIDFQKTRAAKNNPCSRYYSATQFEVIAASMHPVTQSWDFRFRETRGLPEHNKCPGKLRERVDVGGDFVPNLLEIFDRIADA
jgi:hypothetical protein